MRRNLSYYCLLAPRIYIFVHRAYPVRGESHNQRNTTGEVATVLFIEVLVSPKDTTGLVWNNAT